MSIICLVGKIKGLISETYHFKKKIAWSNAHERNTKPLLEIRKDIKWDTRHHLLAYAFMTSAKYHSLEQRCAVRPDVEKIRLIVKLNLKANSIHTRALFNASDEELNAKIINWINGV